MSFAAAPVARFETSRAVRSTFGVVKRNLPAFVVLALLLSVAPRVLWGAAVTQGWIAGPAIFLGSFVVLAVGCLLNAALVHGAASDLIGQRASFSTCLKAGLERVVPLVGLMLVCAVVVGVAACLLIVPGVVLAVAWVAAVPALVIERRGVWASLKRSASLTKGRRWAVLGVCVVLLLFGLFALLALSIAIGFVSSFSKEVTFFAAKYVVGPATVAVFAVFSAAAGAVIHHELKVSKEGEGAEAVAAAFD